MLKKVFLSKQVANSFFLIFIGMLLLVATLSCKKRETTILADSYHKSIPKKLPSLLSSELTPSLALPPPLEDGRYHFSQFKQGMNSKAFANLLVNSMDDIEVVGQLFMFTYIGREADKEILSWIEKNKIGGVKIFGWNGVDLGEICRSVTAMQKAALSTPLGLPLLVATDQEGGWVKHIKAQTTTTPGNMSIGASGLLKDAYLSSYYIASELRELGINMNFAPTVDIFIEQKSQIIGTRAFSSNPTVCKELASAFYNGHKANLVIATAKHFPGHGNSKEDSHGRLPVIESDMNFLKKNDLVPYYKLIKENIPSVMVGHISFPKITGNNEAATLSYQLITKLLKKEMGFEGIVITDDLNMAGMSKEGVSAQDKSLSALKAGNDIILISKNYAAPQQYQRQWESVIDEYRKNDEFKKQAKESAKRVVKVKLDYLTHKNHVTFFPDEQEAKKNIPNKEGQQFFFNQALRGITQLSQNPIIYNKEEPLLLVGYGYDFFTQGKEIFPKATYLNIYQNIEEQGFTTTLQRINLVARNYKNIVFLVYNQTSLLLAKSLKAQNKNVAIVSTYVQGDIEEFRNFDSAIIIYGETIYSCKAAYLAIAGELEASRILPYGNS